MKLLLAALVAFPISAQEAPKKKPGARKQQAAHTKATPDQIRKFNQLEKKQQKK